MALTTKSRRHVQESTDFETFLDERTTVDDQKWVVGIHDDLSSVMRSLSNGSGLTDTARIYAESSRQNFFEDELNVKDLSP